LPVVNPATGQPLGKVAYAQQSDLDTALAAVQKGFQAWRKVPAMNRARCYAVRLISCAREWTTSRVS